MNSACSRISTTCTRYANLMDMIEGKKAERIVKDLTEVMPGRPTIVEHRHPYDDVRRPLKIGKADPISHLHALTITAAEQQTMNFYMNIGNRPMEPLARGLYLEIGQIEEQHVTHYESMLDPDASWLEMLVMHEYNDAMVTVFAALKDIPPEEYRRATEVTYLGTVWGTLAALRRMLPRDRGTIVQVGSALAYRAIPLQAPYCGAKHAVRGFTDSLRSELIHDKSRVHVTMVQLAAFNTPQFDWGRTRMECHPQPLPPIFQPEVAARGIYFAAHHRCREVWVGAPAVKAILGNELLPGYADRKLAKVAYDGQQTDEPIGPGRPDNLFSPPPGDFGTHGRFDAQAKSRSSQLWWSIHRTALAAGIATLVVVVIGVGVMLGTP